MKLNTDNISYEPKNWIESEKRFEPFVFNKVKNDELLNFKDPPRYALSHGKMFSIDVVDIILLNKFDFLSETMRIGKKYADIALSRNAKVVVPGKSSRYSDADAKFQQYDLLLFFDWIETGEFNEEYVNQILNIMLDAYNEEVEKHNNHSEKVNFIFNARCALLYGNIDLAKKFGENHMKCKKTRYMNEKMIYDKKKFSEYIVGAVLKPSNAEFKEEVGKIILYFLQERRKGNFLLKLRCGFKYFADIDLIMLWYKYFSEYNLDEISPYEIIQDCRYGVRGHEDMEQLALEGKEVDWWKKFYD